jgi:SAM-dependent methyltransferase
MKLCSNCDSAFDHENWQCPYCLFEPEKIAGHLAFAPKLAKENEGFKAESFSNLAKLEARNFWFRSRNRLLIWAVQQYFPKAENLLEIGCGTGFVLSGIREAFPKLILCGGEIYSEGLAFAAERLPGVALFQMDSRRIPFREEFDVIGAFDVLEHIQEDEEVLAQMYQATRKGGGILMTVPHHAFLWSPVDDFAHHVRRYKTRELREKVERAGFSVLRLTSFVSLLLPLVALYRFKKRLSSDDGDPKPDYNKISSLTNSTLERILDGERTLIRTGVSFPAGASLLLVARRN